MNPNKPNPPRINVWDKNAHCFLVSLLMTKF
jgi:hypothetical protein